MLFKVLIGVLPIFSSLCLGADRSHDVIPDAVVTFPIELDGTSFVPVEVFNETVHFLIDTGSSRSALDQRFREHLGPVVAASRLTTVTDVRQIELFAAPEMKVGSPRSILFQLTTPVCCFDFSNPKSAAGVNDFGLLGMDCLSTKVLRLNFDEGIGEIRTDPVMESSHVERMRFQRERPILRSTLPGEGVKSFVVDTGAAAGAVVLQRDLFDRSLKKQRVSLLPSKKVSGLDRTATIRLGILECLEFGPHRFFNVLVEEGPENAFNLAFLQRFEIEFDFPKGLARFRPSRRIDAADLRRRVDLGVKRIQGATTAVVAGSASMEALQGIQDGDRLRSINGVPADELLLSKIRLLFCQPGTQIEISFEHDGVTKNVVLHLSNDPDPFPAKSPHELIATTPDFDP